MKNTALPKAKLVKMMEMRPKASHIFLLNLGAGTPVLSVEQTTTEKREKLVNISERSFSISLCILYELVNDSLLAFSPFSFK